MRRSAAARATGVQRAKRLPCQLWSLFSGRHLDAQRELRGKRKRDYNGRSCDSLDEVQSLEVRHGAVAGHIWPGNTVEVLRRPQERRGLCLCLESLDIQAPKRL